MRLFRFTFVVLVGGMTLAMGACSSVPKIPNLISEYRIDIQQGNVISQDMVAQLKPGQTKDQVRYILGTPMLSDVFHGDRWDYVYHMKKGNSDVIESQRFSVFFADGKLLRVAGDVVAASNNPAEGGAAGESKLRTLDLGTLPAGTVLPPAEDEKGYFGRLIDKLKF